MHAVRSKDARFDGWFVIAVATTGVYCRPSCPDVPPKAADMRFYPVAATAQQAGFRACKRCCPDNSPASPSWNTRCDLVARAMRLIADGVVDRDGVAGLAAQLGCSVRQVTQQVTGELGVHPVALARAQRAQTARLLIEMTSLPMNDIALTAGFSSVRTFNDAVQQVFAAPPAELRRRSEWGQQSSTVPGVVSVRLPYRAPLCPDNLFGHLVATAVPSVEEWRDGAYRRTLRLSSGWGVVSLRPASDHIACQLTLTDLRDLGTAISRCRRLLDLDADPIAIDDRLRQDEALAPLVDRWPGRRVPRTVDECEFAIRAVLGQQVSTVAARTHASRLVYAYGEEILDTRGGLTRLFPDVAVLANLDPATLALPHSRRSALVRLIAELASRRIDVGVGSDWEAARQQLSTLPGIGPWTVETIAMRALGDPDSFPATDLGIRAAARHLELAHGSLSARSAAWRPWRSYAVQHLWGLGDHPINRMPTGDDPSPQKIGTRSHDTHSYSD